MTPGHSATDRVLLEFILLKFDELAEVLAELDDDSANTTLSAAGSNSVVQIVVHCCGAMRRWSSSVNRGITIARDRDSEFQVQMPVAETLELVRVTREAFVQDVAATDFDAPPAAVPPGREHFWTVSCRGVLLHVFEEISQHLGQAQISRDVLL